MSIKVLGACLLLHKNLAEDAIKVASPDLCARSAVFQQTYLSTITRKSSGASRRIVLRLLALVSCATLFKSRGYFKYDKRIGGMVCSLYMFYFIFIPPIILSCNLGELH